MDNRLTTAWSECSITTISRSTHPFRALAGSESLSHYGNLPIIDLVVE